MGLKKRRRRKKVERPFCWYCERKFVDERILIMHQKARHFKCDVCFKKLGSGTGLLVHVHQMHGKQLKGVPNSKPGHDSVEREIYGMDGLTAEEITEFRTRTDPSTLRQQSKAKFQESRNKNIEVGEAPVASSSNEPAVASASNTVVLVFSSAEFSQEELRARLDRYVYDEAKVRKQISQLDSEIENRLARWAQR